MSFYIMKIANTEYRVCSTCHCVNLANFYCQNCRDDMRVIHAGTSLIDILDILDAQENNKEEKP